jgi:HK97 family phage prohead protease
MASRETRVMLAPVEFRDVDGSAGKIVGHGSVFNTETVIAGRFREMVAPGAFSRAVQEDDIRVLFNHDANHVLGRQSAGTAVVAEDGDGLRYEADVNPDDPDALSIAAKIKRRDVTGSSFSFSIESDDDEEWVPPAQRGGMPLRIIKRAKVYDVGPVTFPAYVQAEASARSLAKATEITEAERRAVEAAEAAKPADVKEREALRAALETAKAWRT